MQRKDILFLIQQAVMAPSGHNTQPWLFRIEDDLIRIIPDLSKKLPVVDPEDRELFISLGCAAENIILSAETMNCYPEMQILETGEIVIRLSHRETLKTRTTGLSGQINVRQSNRSVYSGKLIPSSVIDDLVSMGRNTDTGIYIYRNGSNSFRLLTDYIIEGNSRQMKNGLFRKELKEWMRYNGEHVSQKEDGLSFAVFGAPDLPHFISKTVMGLCLNPLIQNRSDREKIKFSSDFALFTVTEDCMQHWITLGCALQRFLLYAAKNGVACAFMNQPCEVKDLSSKIRKEFNLSGYPAILLRIGYAPSKPRSPRKSVDSFIIA